LSDKYISKYLLEQGCIDYVINKKNNGNQVKNNTYQIIDIESNRIRKDNYRLIKSWTKEALYSKGMINTRKAGLMLLGL